MLAVMTVSSTGNTAKPPDTTIYSEYIYLSFYIVIDKQKGTSRIVIDVGNKC